MGAIAPSAVNDDIGKDPTELRYAACGAAAIKATCCWSNC